MSCISSTNIMNIGTKYLVRTGQIVWKEWNLIYQQEESLGDRGRLHSRLIILAKEDMKKLGITTLDMFVYEIKILTILNKVIIFSRKRHKISLEYQKQPAQNIQKFLLMFSCNYFVKFIERTA